MNPYVLSTRQAPYCLFSGASDLKATTWSAVVQVRGYAVTVLSRTDDEEIKSYLLQLVHALRYERSDSSDLAAFLVARGGHRNAFGLLYSTVVYCSVVWRTVIYCPALSCTLPLCNLELSLCCWHLILPLALCPLLACAGCSDFVLANFLHWYLRVERQDPNFAARYAFVHDSLLSSLLKVCQGYTTGDQRYTAGEQRYATGDHQRYPTGDRRFALPSLPRGQGGSEGVLAPGVPLWCTPS